MSKSTRRWRKNHRTIHKLDVCLHVCMNDWMTEFYSLDRNSKINQAGTPRHDNCVRLPVSWVTINNWLRSYKKLIRRWDSERELSLRRHCTRTKNTIDTCINSATDRFLQRRFIKFSEITQCNGHYAVQGHSRSPILVPIESSYTTSY